MFNFKIFVLNGLAGPYRKFLGMAVKKFGNFTRPIVHIVFKSIFQLIRTISRNFALELTVQYVYENCDSFQCLTHCIFFFFKKIS